MTLVPLVQAKRNAVAARRRLDSTLGALQLRLKPGNLAGEAWDGVKEKGADLTDGALEAVKKRPAMVSVAVGALALFLARDPIKRAVGKMISGDEDEDGRVVTRIETEDAQFNLKSPIVDQSVNEGVS